MRVVPLVPFLGFAFIVPFPALSSQDLAELLDEAEQSEKARPRAREAAEPGRTVTQSEKALLPIPSPVDQRVSAAKVREIYGKDAASAGTPALKARLARQLVEQAGDTDNASDKYALLDAASRLAIEAGDPRLLQECRAAMGSEFQVTLTVIQGADIESLAAKAPVETLADVTQFILEASHDAAEKGRFELAEDFAKTAGTAAKRARNPSLVKSVSARLAEVRGLRKQEADLKPLLDRFAADPNDRDAAKQVGMIRCFTQSRWAEGVPLLAKGDDPELAKICALELRQVRGSTVAAADAWWAYADGKKPAVKDAVRRHAADLYMQVLPDLGGLDKVRIEKRMQEAALGAEGSEKPVYLADVQEASVNGAKYGFSKDGTYLGKPFTCMDERWPKAITAIPDSNSAAVVEYQFPASPSRIQGRVAIFSAADAKPDQQPGSPVVFEVVADGRVVWRSQPMGRREAVQPFRADLRGATVIELRTICTGDAYCDWGAWLDVQVVQ
jgi:hypothetical protein